MGRMALRWAARWADEEVRDVRLGDERRRARLKRTLARVLQRPGGCLPHSVRRPCERTAAYRLLEGGRAWAQEVTRAGARACARRLVGLPYALVPVDGTGLSLADRQRARGLGPVGARAKRGRGLLVETALGLSPVGETLGVLGQVAHVRSEARVQARKGRSLEEKETRHTLRVMEEAGAARDAGAPGVRLWYQLDRGCDFRQLHLWTCNAAAGDWVTVRAAQDRRVLFPEDTYLFAAIHAAPRVAHLTLRLPRREGVRARARKAHLTVRSDSVLVRLRDAWNRTQQLVVLQVVSAREEGRVPEGQAALHWVLLTNRPVHTAADALAVVQAYAARWRVEDFHKTWKSVCRVEDTQLRTRDAILSWAAMLALVSARLDALKHLSRTQPQALATGVFSPEEVRALLLLSRPEEVGRAATLSVREATVLLAQLGGWSGNFDKKPPGSLTLSRGLADLDVATRAIAAAGLAKK